MMSTNSEKPILKPELFRPSLRHPSEEPKQPAGPTEGPPRPMIPLDPPYLAAPEVPPRPDPTDPTGTADPTHPSRDPDPTHPR
jgi:hypothetical protein